MVRSYCLFLFMIVLFSSSCQKVTLEQHGLEIYIHSFSKEDSKRSLSLHIGDYFTHKQRYLKCISSFKLASDGLFQTSKNTAFLNASAIDLQEYYIKHPGNVDCTRFFESGFKSSKRNFYNKYGRGPEPFWNYLSLSVDQYRRGT